MARTERQLFELIAVNLRRVTETARLSDAELQLLQEAGEAAVEGLGAEAADESVYLMRARSRFAAR
jgi:hypothetical protein